MPQRKLPGPPPKAVPPQRYVVRCRPAYANWGLYSAPENRLIVSGSKERMEAMAAAWNANDPHHGLPLPAGPHRLAGETEREEWPPGD